MERVTDVHRASGDDDSALIGVHSPAQHLDDRALARPVLTDEPNDFAGGHAEAGVIHDCQAAVPLRQTLRSYYYIAVHQRFFTRVRSIAPIRMVP